MSDLRQFARAHSEGLLYLSAGVSYVGVSLFEKSLLNWIVGPVWLVVWVEFLPRIAARLRRPRVVEENV